MLLNEMKIQTKKHKELNMAEYYRLFQLKLNTTLKYDDKFAL